MGLNSGCIGQRIQIELAIDGGIPPYTYHWEPEIHFSNPYIKDPYYTVPYEGYVYATVEDEVSCIYRDSMYIRVDTIPPIDILGDTLLCVGERETLEVKLSTCMDTVKWLINGVPAEGWNKYIIVDTRVPGRFVYTATRTAANQHVLHETQSPSPSLR